MSARAAAVAAVVLLQAACGTGSLDGGHGGGVAGTGADVEGSEAGAVGAAGNTAQGGYDGVGGGGGGSGGAAGIGVGGSSGGSSQGAGGGAGGATMGAGGVTGGTGVGGRGGGGADPGPMVGTCPQRAVWPDASNTGVPMGTVLKPSGGLTISKDGSVVDGLDIKGCVRVSANDVVLRRSRITRTGDCGIITTSQGTKGLVLEDVEIDAAGGAMTFSVAVLCNDCSICRLKLHDVDEGVRAISNVSIQESYVYNIGSIGINDNASASGSDSRIVIRHNTVEDPPGIPGNVEKSWHALIQVSTDHGVPNGVVIDDNLLAGGPWAISVGGASNVQVLNNHVSKKFYPRGGMYGALSVKGATGSGNVWHETGAPISF